MKEKDEALQEMYRREFILDQFKDKTRFELIERIRNLENLLVIEEKKPESK